MRRARHRLAAIAMVAIVTSCCGSPTLYPDFAGVPDAKCRVADLRLPLERVERETLLRRLVKAEGTPDDPGSETELADRYAKVLDALSSPSITFEAVVGEQGPLFVAAGAPRRMRVNDAREDHVALDVTRAFAFVSGGFAWAIYQHKVNDPAGPMQLVVFPRQFVLTKGAR